MTATLWEQSFTSTQLTYSPEVIEEATLLVQEVHTFMQVYGKQRSDRSVGS